MADLTGNLIDESDAEILHRALRSNSTVTTLDLRGNTGIGESSESVQAIFRLTRENEVKGRLAADLGYTAVGGAR